MARRQRRAALVHRLFNPPRRSLRRRLERIRRAPIYGMLRHPPMHLVERRLRQAFEPRRPIEGGG